MLYSTTIPTIMMMPMNDEPKRDSKHDDQWIQKISELSNHYQVNQDGRNEEAFTKLRERFTHAANFTHQIDAVPFSGIIGP